MKFGDRTDRVKGLLSRVYTFKNHFIEPNLERKKLKIKQNKAKHTTEAEIVRDQSYELVAKIIGKHKLSKKLGLDTINSDLKQVK